MMKNSHISVRTSRCKVPIMLFWAAAAIGLLVTSEILVGATSVSQFGITWTFSEDKPVGQYANGDWWVVGPVTITKITPESVTDPNIRWTSTNPAGTFTGWTRNGTMVNPPPSYLRQDQGYDGSCRAFAWWNPALNVAPSFKGSPLVASPGTSVISSISLNAPNKNVVHTQLAAAAILTVVTSPPAAGSFRPPEVGNDKTHRWNKANLNYGILRKLAPVATTPALATVEQYFERPYLFQFEGNSIQTMTPTSSGPNYGRDQAHLISHGLLSLHLNYTDAQKERLFIRMVQMGIDIYGATKAGQVWKGAGGLNAGRKAPMLLAALALNDSNMLEWSNAAKHFVFQEDQQTFFVKQSDVGRALYTIDGRPREQYRQEHVGMPEWGEYHTQQPERDGSNWNTAYRWIGAAWHGNILAIKLIPGGEAAWNWPPVFAYADRFWSVEGVKQTYGLPNGITPFVCDMWRYYRAGGYDTIVPPPPDPVVTFAIGDRIRTLNATNVRATGALSGTLLGAQISGSAGTIIAGPIEKDDITWWQVNYDTGADGWSGADNFTKVISKPKGLELDE